MQTNWKEDLKKIKIVKAEPKKIRKSRKVYIRPRKRFVDTDSINKPFSGLKDELEKRNGLQTKTNNAPTPLTKKYHTVVNREAEIVMIKSAYSLGQIEMLIKQTVLRDLVASIKVLDCSYYQIELIKEPLHDGGSAAQRVRLGVLGEIVAHSDSSATGLQDVWKFEEEEDLGYY